MGFLIFAKLLWSDLKTDYFMLCLRCVREETLFDVLEKIRPIVSRIACVNHKNPRLAPAEELVNRLNEVGFSKTYVAPIEEIIF